MSTFYRQRENTFYHGDALRHRDEVKRHLLKFHDSVQARLERLETVLRHSPITSPPVRESVLELLSDTLLLAEELNVLSGDKFINLYGELERIEGEVRDYINSITDPGHVRLSLSLGRKGIAPGPEKLIGGKAANLGRLAVLLPGMVPGGFIITSDAYYLFMEENHLQARIQGLLKDLDVVANMELYANRTREVREMIESSPVPEQIVNEIRERLKGLSGDAPTGWAVRSTCVGEDGKRSFAGQFDSKLNVPADELANAYRSVLASRFTDRAVYYRMTCGFSEVDTPMAVLFMPMVPARFAGVLYTRDPRDGDADRMIINSVWGLAADLLLGRSVADTFVARRSEPGVVEERKTVEKSVALEPADGGSLEKTQLDESRSSAPSLSPEDIEGLVKAGRKVEEYFGAPQDMEWVITPEGEIRFVQARLLTARDLRQRAGDRAPVREELIAEGGRTIFPGWASGPAYVIDDPGDLSGVPSGAILVVKKATPDIIQLLPHLGGLIVEEAEMPALPAARVQGFAIPCLCSIENAGSTLAGRGRIILDAEERKVYKDPQNVEQKNTPAAASIPDPLNELFFLYNDDGTNANGGNLSLRDIMRLVRDRATQFNIVSGRIKD